MNILAILFSFTSKKIRTNARDFRASRRALLASMVIVSLPIFIPPGGPRASDAPPGHLNPPAGVSPQDFKQAYEKATGLQTVYRSIYESVRPSVVQIVVENVKDSGGYSMPNKFFRPRKPKLKGNRLPRSMGAGFIIDKDGLIVTNRHVVGNAKTVLVKLHDGRNVKGVLKGSDKITDIALIRIKGVKGLKAVSMGDSTRVHVGDLAIAVGSPFGFDGTFTTGVISAVGRQGLDNSGVRFIQTDASINQGNSGGPLLNLRGEVIGINRMIVSPSGGSVGIGFAIPINQSVAIIKEIRRTGRITRPFLGVRISFLPEEKRESLGEKGILVVSIQRGSSAWKAGVEPGDVILKIDNKNLIRPDQLVNYVQTKSVGDNVTLFVVRSGKKRQIKVRLGSRPDSPRF